jgi:hypothetical protein
MFRGFFVFKVPVVCKFLRKILKALAAPLGTHAFWKATGRVKCYLKCFVESFLWDITNGSFDLDIAFPHKKINAQCYKAR